MDENARTMLGLVDHGGDTDAARRWFAAMETAYRGDGEQPSSWDEFGERFREAASSSDPAVVEDFLRQADRELSDPLEGVGRIADRMSTDEAVAAYLQVRSELAGGDGVDAGDGEPEFAMERLQALLTSTSAYAGSPWAEYREYLVSMGDYEGLVVEVTAFVEYADAAGVPDAFVAYQVTVDPAVFGGAEVAATPEGAEVSPEQAQADALDLGRRALAALQAQLPDTPIEVSDEQLMAIVDREIRATQGA